MPHKEASVGQFKEFMSQLIPVISKNLLMVACGMAQGYPTILIPNLSDPKGEIYLDEEQISWIGSIMWISLPFGCLASAIVSQAIGRKITMQVSCVLLIACWLIFKYCNAAWQILLALFIGGFTSGLAESPVLTYVAEITRPGIRGALLSTGPLSVTLGMFLEFFLGSSLHWRDAALYSVVLPIISFCWFFIVPESPYWLIMKNRPQKAQESLAWVRGWTTTEKIQEEYQEMELNNPTKRSFRLVDFSKPQFIRPFVLLCFLFSVYNFSGLVTIPVYAVKIFQSLQVPIDEYTATTVLGVAQFLGCVICVLVVPHIGKRRIAVIATILAATSAIAVATFAHLINVKYLYSVNVVSQSNLLNYTWLPLVFILLSAFALNGGVRTLCWNVLAEVFPLETRSIATGSLGAISYMFGFICNKVFLSAVASITLSGVFWFFGLVSVVGCIIIYLWLPETEGKTLQDITNHFAGNGNLDKNVKRSRPFV